MKKTIGIIGGMGPAATADLYMRIIDATDAQTDGEHLHVIIDGNTAIPDRTAAILRGGPDPAEELCGSACRLEVAGAELLVMSCNTAHYFYDRITPHISVPFLHMPRETAKEAERRGYRAVALLATDGTCEAGVYQRAFETEAPQIRLIRPDADGQKRIMSLIYDNVKAGRYDMPKEEIDALLAQLKGCGAEAFILGCTELPLAFRHYGFDAEILDPTMVLARAAVLAAGGTLKEEK